MRVLLLRGCVIGRADERTSGRADGPAGGRAGSRTDGRTGRQTYGHTGIPNPGHAGGHAARGIRAATPPPAPGCAPQIRNGPRGNAPERAAPAAGPRPPPAPARTAGAWRRSTVTRRATARPSGTTPKWSGGRHPSRPRGGRSAARGGYAAADSGIPAAAPPAAPGAGGRRAPGHDRRLPRLPVTTLHQPSDRQGPRSRSGFPPTITPPRERRPPRRGMRRGGRLADGPSARCGCHQLLERSHAVRAVTRPFTVGCLYTFTELLSAECGRGLFGQYVPHQRSARLLRAHAHFVHDRPPSLDAADTLQETPVRPRPVAFGVHSGDGHFGRPRRTHTRRAANDQPTGPARVAV